MLDRNPTFLRTSTRVIAGAAVGYALYHVIRRLKNRTVRKKPIKRFGKLHYPVTEEGNKSSVYHGVEVKDPYQWLEDPDAPEVKEWVEAQNETTNAYYDRHLSHDVERFSTKMKALYTYDKYGNPFKKGNNYFFHKKAGLQNQYVLYKQKTMEKVDDGTATVLLDPNGIRTDGTASIQLTQFDEQGKKLCYGISYSGSDWVTLFIKDVETGKDEEDEMIEHCKFTGVAWLKDGSGFFYARFAKPASAGKEDGKGTETEAVSGQMVYFHRLGTKNTEQNDELIYENKENPKWLYDLEVTDDGRYLFISPNDSCDPVNRLFSYPLTGFDANHAAQSLKGKMVTLVDNFDHRYSYITNIDDRFFFMTNREAKRYKVFEVNFPAVIDGRCEAAKGGVSEILSRSQCRDFIPQDPTSAVLSSVASFKHGFVLVWERDVKSILEVVPYDYDGVSKKQEIPLSSLGSVDSVSTNRKGEFLFYSFSSFNDPGSSYHVDLSQLGQKSTSSINLISRKVQTTEVPTFNPSDYDVSQVFYSSKDGTRVPMFIMKSRNAPPGPRPTLLYGYGGFNISIPPSFSLSRTLWCKNFGATFAVANIRGGGEYGEDWHDAGTKQNKQNVFDDFISAAQYLIQEGHTTPSQLAIQGGSNGGLLVGACINQQPALFAAAVAQVGVMDMLKFHKFTIGHAWCSDYGNADESEKDFKTLYAYSPVHNINHHAKYPATLLTTGDHDDRVVPLHSYKYIAALQKARGNKQEEPLLIRIDTKSGHGAGKPTNKVIEEVAELYCFIAAATKAKWIEDSSSSSSNSRL